MKAVFFFGRRDSETIHVSNHLHQPASSSSSSSFSSSSAEMRHRNWSSWCVKALVGFGGASACSSRQCLNFTSAVSQAAPPGGVQQRPTGAMVGSSNWISHYQSLAVIWRSLPKDSWNSLLFPFLDAECWLKCLLLGRFRMATVPLQKPKFFRSRRFSRFKNFKRFHTRKSFKMWFAAVRVSYVIPSCLIMFA